MSAPAAAAQDDLDALRALLAPRLARIAAAPEAAERLVHGRGGSAPGLEHLAVDRFGLTLRLGVHLPRDAAWCAAAGERLARACVGTPIVGAWLQWRLRGEPGRPAERLFGDPADACTVIEDGLRYAVRPGAARNAGLFLDAAPLRRLIRRLAPGARILNLFAYTCAFSVAALAGGAREVVNVDMARGALAVGQRNHTANGLAGARFLPHDLFRSWGALRRRGPFDLVIVDPPPFQRGSFEFDRHWPRLLARLDGLVATQGRVLALCNAFDVDRAAFEASLRARAPAFVADTVPLPAPSPDFPETDPDRGLKVALLRRAG